MENYKGLYYKEIKEQKYYEGGAHFPYKVLYKILLNLGGKISNEEYNNHSINKYNYTNKNNDNENNNYIDSLLQRVKDNKNKNKTRNIEQLNYMNNPNTLNKYLSQNNNQKENNKNNYISRNVNNENKFWNNKNNTTSINLNRGKNNRDNHLLHMLLNKKLRQKEKQNEEKNNEESRNDNRYSFLNYYKFNHYRNRSLYSNKSEINKQSKNNNIENISENRKDNYQLLSKNKMNLIINYNNFQSLDNYGKNKELERTKEILNKNKENISSLYTKQRGNSYIGHMEYLKRKSRNINNDNIEYKTTLDNNKNDMSQNKAKYINNYLYKTSENNNIRQEIGINNDTYMINLNKDNIWKNIEVNKNDRLMEKYRRKKINKLGCFNLINGKAKSGNNIFAKNINRLNIVNNKYLMK